MNGSELISPKKENFENGKQFLARCQRASRKAWGYSLEIFCTCLFAYFKTRLI